MRADDDAPDQLQVADVVIGGAVAVPAPAVAVEAAAPALAPVAQWQGGAAGLEARLAPLRAQLAPLLTAELSFAGRVCEWSDEQRRAAISAGKKWLKDYTQRMAGNPVANRGVVQFVNGPAAGLENVVNAGDFVETALADVIRDVLTDDQKATYDAELAKRGRFRMEAVITNMVARLDDKLDLSATQRRKIAHTLEARWRENWAPAPEAFMHMGDYVPAIPDEYVTPHLSVEQRALWNGLQKVHFQGAGVAQAIFPRGVVIDDVDLNEVE